MQTGIPALWFGPYRESLAHIIDEYGEVDDPDQARNGYGALREKFLTEWMEMLSPDGHWKAFYIFRRLAIDPAVQGNYIFGEQREDAFSDE